MSKANAAAAIEKLIAAREAELVRIRAEFSRLPEIEADVSALRRAHALMTGRRASKKREAQAKVQPAAPSTAKKGPREPSMSERYLPILAGMGRPMHHTEIKAEMDRRGGRQVQPDSLLGALNRDGTAGKVKYHGRGKYGPVEQPEATASN